MLRAARSSLLFLLILSVPVITNCSKVGFTPAPLPKAMSAPVFDEQANQDVVRGEDSNKDSTRDGSKNPLTLDVHRVCSNKKSEEGGNVLSASKVNFAVLAKNGNVVCSDTKDYKSALINNKTVTMQINCKLSEGEYKGVFYSPNLTKSASQDKNIGDLRFKVDRNGNIQVSKSEKLNVTYAYNLKEGRLLKEAEKQGALDQDQTRCDSFQSPLVVRLKDKSLKLSAPLDGIKFDILGDNGSGKKQISWPIDDTIGFIALPDARGSVHSIDQLFGNNTKGPDGKFADDGYAALAKYDLNGDGRIDSLDPIYSSLRIFIDYNRNGRSDAGELRSLSSHDIQAISLNFDPSYSEEDSYGNKILFKSVAETSNQLLLVFDIWFRLID